MTRITADWLTAAPAQRVCAMLDAAGHQAWFVGGCVRNALLGVPVADYDISTDARPKKVMDLAEAAGLRTVPTGIDHGTVTVIVDGVPFEITTFRRDVATDGRRAVVAFSDDIAEDARRRDFTMNALYCGADGVVADPLGGLPDLNARRVRFIEDADRRIREDYLRILRFFRFHAWYGADGVDPEGLAACAANVDGIETLSAERVGQELLKLLAAPDPAPALASMAACGALMRVLPGANAAALAPLVHVEQAAGLDPDPLRRFAILGDESDARRLRLSKQQARQIADLRESETKPGVLGYRHGAELARDILAVQGAALGQEVTADQLAEARAGAGAVFPLHASDLPHLYGKALGDALKRAESRWIDSGFTLTKDDLLA